MLSLERPVFTPEKFDSCFNVDNLNKFAEEACRTAVQHPKAFYLFMQRYIHFNSQAGSLVARLASSVGLSRTLFMDSAADVYHESDRGMEIAARIIAATVDEHSDTHGKELAHRSLAQATLKSVGDYAQLTAAERNELGQIPGWLASMMEAQTQAYQGEPNNLQALMTAMGVHAASEVLADREYVAIDRIVRFENKNQGYDAYLRDGHGKVEVAGHTIGAWYWVAVHGSHTQSGVEKEHFDEALSAINLATRYLPDDQEMVSRWVFEGFSAFATMQQSFFRQVHEECLELIKRELNSAVS
jgi:hypothetical protein